MNKISAVVKAAAILFDRKGYLETSLKDISTAANLSKGGLYHYFSGKHEILYYVLDNYVDLLLGNLEEELKEIPDGPSKLRYLLFRHLKHYNAQVPEARALLNHAHNLPMEYFKVVAGKQKKYASILTDILSGLSSGRMDKAQLETASYIMFGMCNSIMYSNRAVSLEELSQTCYDIFMGGIMALISPRQGARTELKHRKSASARS
jgi:AcrR family transcriptional regulator